MSDLFIHPAFLRAVVLGAFGGIGLVLTGTFSHRGPLIFPVYAAFLAAVALLLARYDDIPYPVALSAAMAGFVVAGGMHYIGVTVSANRQRRLLGIAGGVSIPGHLWRLGFLFSLGFIASAGVAFVAS